jgi:hypothetical protein
MAASGYTPISLYYSTTASAVPVNTNLANGELAINITDGKLYYKNNSNVVTLLASAASAAVTTPVSIANGGTGQTTAAAALTALGGIGTGKSIAMAMIFGF